MTDYNQINRLYYQQLHLETIDLEPEDFEQATLLSDRFKNEAQQWQAYVKILGLLALKKWLSDRHLTLDNQIESLPPHQIISSEPICPLQVNGFTVCLLTDENIVNEGIEIPDKMINTPEFAAHFYILIQVSVEEEEAILIGFIRHDQFKNRSLQKNERGNYPLSLTQLNYDSSHLILNLKYLNPVAIKLPEKTSDESKYWEKLTSWLEGIFTETWQPVEELIKNRKPIIQMAFRSYQTTEKLSPKVVKKFLQQFQITEKPRDKTQVDLSQPELSDTEVNKALVQILQTTEDEETRWQIAELLWEINPSHPAAGVRRAIDLGMQLAGDPVALMIAILPKPNQRFAVLSRVYPLQDQRFLPANLKLIGLDEMGESLFEIRARQRDDYIQFKFTADPGDRFSLQVSLNSATVTKHFIISVK
ncbi:DUF1822 family protein [Okeania sp. KiyG1]|uniref:DUF1822 family protein n=1 Tax=Okeania sp. KiyG1 TaxID=2720165 RepID=UPI001921C12D|nr:DUF1822 family protein [Okeania sp. KiyG1]GGA16993.1 hypothetical protein CYANOKiyG1_31210 [Okeania sp. KiyG1]